MNDSLSKLLEKFRTATTPEDVFGDLDLPQDVALKRRYRFLANVTHPDRNPGDETVAEETFKLLQHWMERAERKVAQGRYGQTVTFSAEIKTCLYQSFSPPKRGDLCDLFTLEDGNLAKVVRKPKNNDLMEAEATALKKIGRNLQSDPLLAHFPRLIDSFRIRDAAQVERRVNVLRFESKMFSLAQVRERYPNGIDSADMAWMFNRLLAALGKAHENSLVHGAVVPEHFLIRPADHNGILIDWCYSVKPGTSVKAISPARKPFYPPEVLQKQPATPATDLYMASACMIYLLGGDGTFASLPTTVPRPIAALLRGCMIPSPHRRAGNAWEIFDEFREILQRLYGAPKFREFRM